MRFSWRNSRTISKTLITSNENVLKVLAKSIFIPLGLTATASETDADIQKEIHGSGTKLMISNKKMKVSWK